MKTYNIMLSQVFPVTHPRAGEPTGFSEKVLDAINDTPGKWKKLHTIRANWRLWYDRCREVQEGKAQLVLRRWTGKPYRSKTEIIATLTANDGVWMQPLDFWNGNIRDPHIITPRDGGFCIDHRKLAHNDGLTETDWLDWFKGYDLSQRLAIIHFTNFRY